MHRILCAFLLVAGGAAAPADPVIQLQRDLEQARDTFLASAKKEVGPAQLERLDGDIFAANMKVLGAAMQAAPAQRQRLLQGMQQSERDFFRNSRDVQAIFAKLPDARFGQLLPLKVCFLSKTPETECYHLTGRPPGQ
jgi:hypothetical protein